MSDPYLDHSVYPDVSESPDALVTDEEKADYMQRICAAWDFDLYPEPKTFALLGGWEDVPMRQNPFVHLTYEVLDRLEGREPTPCISLV